MHAEIIPAVAPETELINIGEEEETIRGICPCCGSYVRSKLYYVGGRGYLTMFVCDAASPADADDTAVCEYRRVL